MRARLVALIVALAVLMGLLVAFDFPTFARVFALLALFWGAVVLGMGLEYLNPSTTDRKGLIR